MFPPPLWTHRARVLALYRATLKEARKLPTERLQLFFRDRTRERFRSNVNLNPRAAQSRMKILEREYRRLQATTAGERHAVIRAIEMAFGRRGKLRHTLMDPIITHPTAIPPPLIIPQSPKSSPPAYSAPLRALLTSSLARPPKAMALQSVDLDTPPTLPARADPKSEDARLLGRLSLRREVNIRRRFYDDIVGRVYPPLVIRDETQPTKRPHGEDMFDELKRLSEPPPMPYPPRRVLSSPLKREARPPFKPSFGKRERFWRRRFTEALALTPILHERGDGKPPIVTISAAATGRGRAAPVKAKASGADMEWIAAATAKSR